MRDVTEQKRPELINKPKSRLERVGAAIDSAVFALAPVWGQRRIAARTKQRLIDRQVQRLGHPSIHPIRIKSSKYEAISVQLVEISVPNCGIWGAFHLVRSD